MESTQRVFPTQAAFRVEWYVKENENVSVHREISIREDVKSFTEFVETNHFKHLKEAINKKKFKKKKSSNLMLKVAQESAQINSVNTYKLLYQSEKNK